MRSNALRKARGGNSSLRTGIAAFVSAILQSYKQKSLSTEKIEGQPEAKEI